jgi:hypothetical protein
MALIFSVRLCGLRESGDVIEGKRSNASRDLHHTTPTQAAHCEVQFIPAELRIAGDQGFEVTFRGALKKREDAFSDGGLLSHGVLPADSDRPVGWGVQAKRPLFYRNWPKTTGSGGAWNTKR